MSYFKTKMHQIRFHLGLCPRTRWGAYNASPDSLAGFKGPTSKGRKGRVRKSVPYFQFSLLATLLCTEITSLKVGPWRTVASPNQKVGFLFCVVCRSKRSDPLQCILITLLNAVLWQILLSCNSCLCTCGCFIHIFWNMLCTAVRFWCFDVIICYLAAHKTCGWN